MEEIPTDVTNLTSDFRCWMTGKESFFYYLGTGGQTAELPRGTVSPRNKPSKVAAARPISVFC